jgi:hypothetical protein
MNIFTKFDRLGCQISPVCVGSGVKFNQLDFLTGQIFYQPPCTRPIIIPSCGDGGSGGVHLLHRRSHKTIFESGRKNKYKSLRPISHERKSPNTNYCGPSSMAAKSQVENVNRQNLTAITTPPPALPHISSSSPLVACSGAARSDLSMDPRGLPLLVILLAAAISAAAAYDEIHGCGGFVEVCPSATHSYITLQFGSPGLVTDGTWDFGFGCRRALAWPNRGRRRTPSLITLTSR